MQNQKLLNNSNFKNNQNYILTKKEKEKIFFLFKFYKNKKFLKDFFETKAFFYTIWVFTWIFPYTIFYSFLVRNYEINNFYFSIFMFIFYFVASYFLYKILIKKEKIKEKWIYILKKNTKKIFLWKYFWPKKVKHSLKKEILELVEENYIILSIIKTNNKKSYKQEY